MPGARWPAFSPACTGDGFEHPDSGWPRPLRRFAAEAWRRAEAGELADGELYACDAQWAGLCDSMFIHTEQETIRRLSLAAMYGRATDDKVRGRQGEGVTG